MRLSLASGSNMLNQVALLRMMMFPLSALFLIEYEVVDMADHPWYRDIIYYLQHEHCPDHLENHERRRLHLEASKYLIMGTLLFCRSIDGLLLCIVLMKQQAQNMLENYMELLT
jgi:hypothetical protein